MSAVNHRNTRGMRYVAVNRCDSKHGMRYVAVNRRDSKRAICGMWRSTAAIPSTVCGMRYVAVNRCDSKHGMRYVAVKHRDSKHGIRYVVVKHRDSKHAYGLMAAVNYIDRLCFSRLLCMVRLAQGNSVC